jgi:acetyl/propionyl-CoA carboxylase alpha subunit
MLAKIIVHGVDRPEAIAKARAALRDFVMLGCGTNAAFLDRLLADPDVAMGAIHTALIGEKPLLTADPPLGEVAREILLGLATLALRPVTDAADAVLPLHAAIGGWRN